MRKISVYLISVLVITILIPAVIVKTFNFVSSSNSAEGKNLKEMIPMTENHKNSVTVNKKDIEYIKVYNTKTKKTEELLLDEYIKGVVAAEMPAKFHIEALKAQAVAARTYAISRKIKFDDGHPDHKTAPICTGVHCQAYLSFEELKKVHGDKWIENYWGKIEEAVESTKGLLIYYNGEIIEPLYHSTSGGMTEDSVNVFASDRPYLKSVKSPNEEEAPKFKEVVTFTTEEFIDKLNKEYPKAKINKNNFLDKIKLVEKTPSGRVQKIAIGDEIVNGRDIRDLFKLNSTNFKVMYSKKVNLIEIETYGYGHGVGMSQWGANGMGKAGKNYKEILKHYYTGVEIKKMK